LLLLLLLLLLSLGLLPLVLSLLLLTSDLIKVLKPTSTVRGSAKACRRT
jgi:hypothetical protein